MSVRELFEIIDSLVKEYGLENVKTTVNSIFEFIETLQKAEEETK